MVDEEDLYTNGVKDLDGLFSSNSAKDDYESNPRWHKYTKFERLKIFLKVREIGWKYWKIRKAIGSAIIGNPRFGKGVLINIPLGWMSEDQKKAWWEARRLMGEAGIHCDSGMGCGGLLDLEFDWSLYGAIALCKRCGYDSRKHVKEYLAETLKEHNACISGKDKNKAKCLDCVEGNCRCLQRQERAEHGF